MTIRVIFSLDKNGDLLSDFKNKKAEYKNYSYYYSSPADILNSMKDVLRHFGVEVPEDRKGDKLKPKKPEKPEKKLDGPEPPKDAKKQKQEQAKKDKDEDAKKTATKDAKAEL